MSLDTGCASPTRTAKRKQGAQRVLKKKHSTTTTGEKKTLLTLRHCRLVPRALLVHRDDRRVVFKPRLAHLAAVHLGFAAL